MTDSIAISLHHATAPLPYSLLLLADPSRDNIDSYTRHADVYTARVDDEIVGCYVLCRNSQDEIEIKNIAVAEIHQRKGVGTYLLLDAISKAKKQHARRLVIGTGNSSIGQLYLYQKAGFRITEIRKNFFTMHYKEPIIENGIPCVDMIMLAMEL